MKTKKRLLGLLLSLALVLGLMPGMSLTALAYEGNPYASLVGTTTTVTFNGKSWFIIADNSTSATKGTVTLLAADSSFGKSAFSTTNNLYSSSTVKSTLDALTASGSFADVADAIQPFTLTTYKYNSTEVYETIENVKIYLLSSEEAGALPEDVRKSSLDGNKFWWLRSPGKANGNAAFVRIQDGHVGVDGYAVTQSTFVVRPALKLNLSSVTYLSDAKTFTVKPAATVTTAPTANTLTYTGSALELITAGEASDGTMQYALGTDATTAPTSGWDASLPKGTNAGPYYVWYKAVGDASHRDSAASCVTVNIAPDPTMFDSVAVPSTSFTFTKTWEGDPKDSINYTLYKKGGEEYNLVFGRQVVNSKNWKYSVQFQSEAACYVIEEPIPGYLTTYVNVGVYAQVTDRCCDGGTIINKKLPDTGDAADFALWAGLLAVGMAGIGIALASAKRKKATK